jgi:hypothetical protein
MSDVINKTSEALVKSINYILTRNPSSSAQSPCIIIGYVTKNFASSRNGKCKYFCKGILV